LSQRRDTTGVVTLNFFGQLKSKVGSGSIKVSIREGVSLKELFRLLAERYPRINLLLDEKRDDIKPLLLIFINGIDSALLGGSDAILKPGDVIDVVPISHGG